MDQLDIFLRRRFDKLKVYVRRNTPDVTFAFLQNSLEYRTFVVFFSRHDYMGSSKFVYL